MNTFGEIKSKIVKELTEAYIQKDKNKISKIIKLIKENKDFNELYTFYDDIEEKYIEDKEIAKLYVEDLRDILKEKSKNIVPICEKFEKILTTDIILENKVYDALDQLLSNDNIKNLDRKIIAKKELIEHLNTKKEIKIKERTKDFTLNERLLSTVLVNNFNSKYSDMLNEEDKAKFKEIISLTEDEIKQKINESKENINSKITNILNENEDSELEKRLTEVKKRINEMDTSRISYYKIIELEKDL